tara:strand:- start:901 stop:3564 length:2664 start_codon:yes stop_codon:yes gene_type:complete
MPLISSTIPNLINGVSQQPPALRLASQAEAVINCMASPVEGLKKRPPLEHIGKLFTGSAGTNRPFTTIVDRDGTIQYLVFIQDGDIKVFGLDGSTKTVNKPNGTGYLDISNSADPSDKFRVASVADYTFIANREKTVTTYFQDGVTYSQSGTTVTVTSTDHGLTTSDRISIDITSGDASGDDGKYDVASVSTNSFTYTSSTSRSTSGNAAYNVMTPTFGTESMVFIKAADYSTTYRIKIKNAAGTSTLADVSYGTAAVGGTLPDTLTIATNLRNSLASALSSGWTFTVVDYVIQIQKNDGGDYQVESADTKTGTFTKAIKGTIDTITDLPTLAKHGFIIKVQGTKTTQLDDYYVKFEASAGSGTGGGIWRETAGPDINRGFNQKTMPHVLVRNADGSFTFKEFDWSHRICGDEATVLDPSFVNSQIQNINLFRNRLVILADENVILSAADNYDRFWPETIQTIVDSDPIDLVTGGTEINFLTSSLAFANTLLLFSRHGQFRLDAGTTTVGTSLTPKTANVTAITSFEMAATVDPVGVGRTIYFPIPKGEFSGLRDFFLPDSTGGVPLSDEVTSSIPRYIPGNLTNLIASVSEEAIVAISKDQPKRLYIYKFFFEGDNKLQSAWSYWEVKGSKTILGASILDSDMYVLLQYNDGVYLEKVALRPETVDAGSTIELLLDRKVTEASCSTAVTNPGGLGVQTTITLPYPMATTGTMAVVGRDVSGNTISHGQVITPTSETLTGGAGGNGTMVVKGDLSSAKFFVGELYDMGYEFSTPYLKEQPSAGGMAVVAGPKLQVRTWAVVFDDTSHFVLRVTPAGRAANDYPYNGISVGTSPPSLGTPGIGTGSFRVPVMASSLDTKVEILSSSPVPCRIQSAEWEGWLQSRAKRL